MTVRYIACCLLCLHHPRSLAILNRLLCLFLSLFSSLPGEPLHNLPAVLSSLATLCHPLGMHFSHNKVIQ